MDFIKATKKTTEGKILTKKFPIETWNILKNKNGWVAIDEVEQPVENIVKRKAPDSGSVKTDELKNQVVENKADKKAEEQIIENQTGGSESNGNVDDIDADKTDDSGSVKTDEFSDAVKASLTKSMIKDYFDKKSIAYSNTASLPVLTAVLSGVLEGSIEKLNEEFNLNSL